MFGMSYSESKGKNSKHLRSWSHGARRKSAVTVSLVTEAKWAFCRCGRPGSPSQAVSWGSTSVQGTGTEISLHDHPLVAATSRTCLEGHRLDLEPLSASRARTVPCPTLPVQGRLAAQPLAALGFRSPWGQPQGSGFKPGLGSPDFLVCLMYSHCSHLSKRSQNIHLIVCLPVIHISYVLVHYRKQKNFKNEKMS